MILEILVWNHAFRSCCIRGQTTNGLSVLLSIFVKGINKDRAIVSIQESKVWNLHNRIISIISAHNGNLSLK